MVNRGVVWSGRILPVQRPNPYGFLFKGLTYFQFLPFLIKEVLR
jgi:hypothetical protein